MYLCLCSACYLYISMNQVACSTLSVHIQKLQSPFQASRQIAFNRMIFSLNKAKEIHNENAHYPRVYTFLIWIAWSHMENHKAKERDKNPKRTNNNSKQRRRRRRRKKLNEMYNCNKRVGTLNAEWKGCAFAECIKCVRFGRSQQKRKNGM